jgi:hypothetical protein
MVRVDIARSSEPDRIRAFYPMSGYGGYMPNRSLASRMA